MIVRHDQDNQQTNLHIPAASKKFMSMKSKSDIHVHLVPQQSLESSSLMVMPAGITVAPVHYEDDRPIRPSTASELLMIPSG